MRRILKPDAQGNWMGWAARDYTPERVESILRSGLWGDHTQQWELFAMMEDTWPHLVKCISEIREAVVQYDWDVDAWAEEDEAPTPDAEQRAKVVSRAIWTMRPSAEEAGNAFEETIRDLLEAWVKGTTVLEIEWETRSAGTGGTIVAPRQTHWVHPRNYGWQDGTLLLRLPEVAGGGKGRQSRESMVPFPPAKFLIGHHKSKSGPILGAALLRPLAWWWCAANFSASWLLNLSQIFGLPIRWATYTPGAPTELITEICDMLENMGSNAWGAFPAGTQIELKEATKSAGQSPQDSLLDRADRQCSLLLLGQTLTTDVGGSGSRALGEVHLSVRDQIIEAAAQWVAGILNRQLVPPLVQMNFGDDLMVPEICARRRREEDMVKLAQRDDILLKHLRIGTAWLHQRHGVPLPQPGEDTIGGQAAAAPLPAPGVPGAAPLPVEEEDEDPAMEARLRRLAGQSPFHAALARSLQVPASWLNPLAGWMSQIEAKLADDSLTPEQLVAELEAARRRLPEIFSGMDHQALADVLAGAQLRAAARVDQRVRADA